MSDSAETFVVRIFALPMDACDPAKTRQNAARMGPLARLDKIVSTFLEVARVSDHKVER